MLMPLGDSDLTEQRGDIDERKSYSNICCIEINLLSQPRRIEDSVVN